MLVQVIVDILSILKALIKLLDNISLTTNATDGIISLS